MKAGVRDASRLGQRGPDGAEECAECGGRRLGRIAARDALTPRAPRLLPRQGQRGRRPGRERRCGQRTFPSRYLDGMKSETDFQL